MRGQARPNGIIVKGADLHKGDASAPPSHEYELDAASFRAMMRYWPEAMAKRFAIAGGGIGGLTPACCLLNAGYDVELFEPTTELGETGAGIPGLHVIRVISL